MSITIVWSILIYQLYIKIINYLNFDTNIKLDFRNYESDNNYPYISLLIINNNILNFYKKILNNQSKTDYYYINGNCLFNASHQQLFDKQSNDHYFKDYYISSNNNHKSIQINLLMCYDSYLNDLDNHIALIRTININDIVKIIDRNSNYTSNKILSILQNFNSQQLENIVLHSHPYTLITDFHKKEFQFQGFNHSIIIRKSIKVYLSKPHGNCSYYDRSAGEQPFNANSYTHCMRRCIRHYFHRYNNYTPFYVNNYLHELDFETNLVKDLRFYSFDEHMNRNVSTKCVNYCPKDCLTVEYNSRVVTTDSRIGNHLWHNSSPQNMSTEKALVWDSTQPIPVYREEPVMSLTDLMVYTGGLFGLWFGTNIKDVIIWFIDSRLWICIYNKCNTAVLRNKIQLIQ